MCHAVLPSFICGLYDDSGPAPHCEPEKLVGTKFLELVRCYTAAKMVGSMTLKSENEMASKEKVTLSDTQVKSR